MQQKSLLPNQYKVGDVVRVGHRAGRIAKFSADEKRVQIDFPTGDGGQMLWHDVSELPELTRLEKSRAEDDLLDEHIIRQAEATLKATDDNSADDDKNDDDKNNDDIAYLTPNAKASLDAILGDDDIDESHVDRNEDEIERLTAELEAMESRVEALTSEIETLRSEQARKHDLQEGGVRFKTLRHEYDAGGKGNGANEFDREVQAHLENGWEIIGNVQVVHEPYGDFLYAFVGKRTAPATKQIDETALAVQKSLMGNRETFVQMVKAGASASELIKAGDASAYVAGKAKVSA